MIVSVCDKVTGRVLIVADDAPGTKAARFIAEGHTRVESAPPSAQHRWTGTAWAIDADLQALKEHFDTVAAIARADADMPRLTEDILDVLIERGVIALADLPSQAVAKFEARKALRAQTN